MLTYVDPVIAYIVSCLFAFIQSNSTGVVVDVLLMYLAIKLIDDLLIQPLTIGRTLSLEVIREEICM